MERHKEIILKMVEAMNSKGQTPTKNGIASYLDIMLDRPKTYFLKLMNEMDLQIEEF